MEQIEGNEYDEVQDKNDKREFRPSLLAQEFYDREYGNAKNRQSPNSGKTLFYRELVVALVQEGKSAQEIHDEILIQLGTEIDIEKIDELVKKWNSSTKERDSINSNDIKSSDVSIFEKEIRGLIKENKKITLKQIQEAIFTSTKTKVKLENIGAIVQRLMAEEERERKQRAERGQR